MYLQLALKMFMVKVDESQLKRTRLYWETPRG